MFETLLALPNPWLNETLFIELWFPKKVDSAYLVQMLIRIFIFLEAWKAGNPATWKGGEVKLCDGLQV